MTITFVNTPSPIVSIPYERYLQFEKKNLKSPEEALTRIHNPSLGPMIKKLLLSEDSWDALRDSHSIENEEFSLEWL